MPATSQTLTYAQLRAYAASAGAADPDTAAAVALAESGGRTDAHNPIPPDDSYGVWQINMIGAMGPDRRKKLGITSNAQLFDPGTNARAMVMLSNGGTNFSAWSTYKSGAYKKFLAGGAASGGSGASGTTTATPGVTNANLLDSTASGLSSALKVVIDAANWIINPTNLLRIVYVGAGVAVAIVGLDMLVQQQLLGKAATALGGESGGSSVKNAGTIAKAALGAKSKAAGAVAKGAAKKAAPAKAAKAAPAKAVAKKAAAAPVKAAAKKTAAAPAAQNGA